MMEPHDTIRTWWDEDASVYDDSVGHAISDPVEAAAWRRALEFMLPDPVARVLDVGTGTGSLALLIAELGHAVTGLDLSDGMLERARTKAEQAGVSIEFVHGHAGEPPSGPFDAVVERHVLWTVPDPVAALRAWREVTGPGGRLVVLEGSWGGDGPFVAVADLAAQALERFYGIAEHHHAEYPGDLSLPLQDVRSPMPFIQAVADAGWERLRLGRLRDVEWAIEHRQPWPLGMLTHRPRFAIIADAPA
ncbi:MAG TPA: methyltransferase domain-containing protein [Actinomycetota bacterium]|jgi:ubiquinone/menaquinone biosynthesis C-methylase UbiE|nr:methyltransferase domain-containing protein [Actinomycetota bacterium]